MHMHDVCDFVRRHGQTIRQNTEHSEVGNLWVRGSMVGVRVCERMGVYIYLFSGGTTEFAVLAR